MDQITDFIWFFISKITSNNDIQRYTLLAFYSSQIIFTSIIFESVYLYFYYHHRYCSIKESSYQKSFIKRLSSKASSVKLQEEKDFSNCHVLGSFYMDEKFLKDFTLYENIWQGLLNELFIVKPKSVYPRFVQIFYANLMFEDASIISRIDVTKISFTMEEI